jgi:DNA-directed RNA polymerase subunit RPC12/RpoP
MTMENNYYIKCPHCSQLISFGEIKHGCFKNYDFVNEQILFCYSCGNNNKKYSKAQKNKNEYARCVDCVLNKYTKQFEICNTEIIRKQEINKLLNESVCSINLQECEKLLKNGANPNYKRHLQISSFFIYDSCGNEIHDTINQPSNLIQLCILRLSDCMLTNIDVNNLLLIYELLIAFGAYVTQNDIDYFTQRYGTPRDSIEVEYDSIEQLEYAQMWDQMYKSLINEHTHNIINSHSHDANQNNNDHPPPTSTTTANNNINNARSVNNNY